LALRKFVERFSKPIEDLDREALESWCRDLDCTPLDQIELRTPVRVAGEVRSVRIVPRAGADALEASVHDGRAAVTAVFLGRRKVPGISPGRRLVLEGVCSVDHGQRVMYNPIYELL
jgi:hypothetical protein